MRLLLSIAILLISISGSAQLKYQLGHTTFLNYGDGDGLYDPGKPDQFTPATFDIIFKRNFQDNWQFESNWKLAVQRSVQGFHTDAYLQLLKENGVRTIWCTQGRFTGQFGTGSQRKEGPFDYNDDPLDPASFARARHFHQQLAIRYSAPDELLLPVRDLEAMAEVWTPGKEDKTKEYLNNEVKVGMDLVWALQAQNEINFRWNVTYILSGRVAGTFFREVYDGVREVSSIKLIAPAVLGADVEYIALMLQTMDSLYQSEGKQMPSDFSLSVHSYMRNGGATQGEGETGETPEIWGAADFAARMDSLCFAYDLDGWFMTETGWSAWSNPEDDSKNAAPALEGFTQLESQGILPIRQTLIFASSPYYEGSTYWHSRDYYDSGPFLHGGMFDRDWNVKPYYTIVVDFLDQFGDRSVVPGSYSESNGAYFVTLDDGSSLGWTDRMNAGTLTPMPSLVISPDPPGQAKWLYIDSIVTPDGSSIVYPEGTKVYYRTRGKN